MYVSEIRLSNFRNYEEEAVKFHPKMNIITGNNAQGKTNLLESIYIMSLGKSFRTVKDMEMIKFGEELSRVKSKTLKNERILEIEISYFGKQKSIKINGLKINKNIELLENLYIVIFSPEDMKIVKEEPEKRRKFMDRELCQLKPVYYTNLGRYKRVLQHRNSLLKNGETNEDVLAVWNQELANYGARIMLERKKFVEKLNKISNEIHGKISGKKENLVIIYEGSVEVKESLEEQKEVFIKKLERGLKKDLYNRNTGFGPHKDDLKINVDQIDIRHFGSQGQQRTAALSLKLAELALIKEETGEEAILLLDDVMSELDGERQSFLINQLEKNQIFITTTEIGNTLSCHIPDSYIFTVKNGKVRRV